MIAAVSADEADLLQACADGRLRENAHGRMVIDGSRRPPRSVTDQVRRRRWLRRDVDQGGWTLTPAGRRALADFVRAAVR